jgi:hypothetical protein
VLWGVATVAITAWLAVRWGLGRGWVLAASLTACDPILLNQSTQIMTETLATLLATAALAGLTPLAESPDRHDQSAGAMVRTRRLGLRSAVTGLLVGLACLCRPTFLPWSVFCAASILRMPWALKTRLQIGTWFAFGVAVTVLPWGWRNWQQFGQLRLSTSHGGYTLLLGNNPSFYRYLRSGSWGDVWDADELSRAWGRRAELSGADDDLFALSAVESSPREMAAARTEAEDDQLAYAFANRFIREEPGMFLWSCVVRVGRLWHVLPKQLSAGEPAWRTAMRWAVAAWYIALFGLALRAATCNVNLLRTPWLWGASLCLVFTIVHAFYWSDMRMRAPLMPFICLLAAGIFQNRREMGDLNRRKQR